MLEFVKYPSAENITNLKFIEQIKDHLSTKALNGNRTQFVAREKIHGTNFSVLITPDSIKFAKRTAIIELGEKFFNYEKLVKDLMPVFEQIKECMAENPEVIGIQLYGEYTAKQAKFNIDYGPESYYLFDIRLVSKSWDPESEKDIITESWYNDELITAFADFYGLKVAPLISTGTLDEMLALDENYKSIVKSLTWDNMYLIHPQVKADFIEEAAEGLVIKPVEYTSLNNGKRIAIKSKTERYSEKKAPRIRKPIESLSELDQELLNNLSMFSTQARVNNVLSKIGTKITEKDFPKILGMTLYDLLTEAEREGYSLKHADSASRVKSELSKIVTETVREIWLDLIK